MDCVGFRINAGCLLENMDKRQVLNKRWNLKGVIVCKPFFTIDPIFGSGITQLHDPDHP